MRRMFGSLTAVLVMALTSVVVVLTPMAASTATALGTTATDPSSQVQNIPDNDSCGVNNAGRWVKFTLGGSGTGTFSLNSGQPKWDGKYTDTGSASASGASGRQITIFDVTDENGFPVTFSGVAAGVSSQNPVWEFTPTFSQTLDLLEFTAAGAGQNTLKNPAVYNGGNISQIAVCGYALYKVGVNKVANFNTVTPTSTTFPITLTCTLGGDTQTFNFTVTLAANGTFTATQVGTGSATVNVGAGYTCTATDSVPGWTTTPGTVTLPATATNFSGATYTVTVTNVRVVPLTTLTVAKNIVGAFPGDASQFTFTVSCSYNNVAIDLNGAAAGNNATLTAPGGTSSLTVRVDAVCVVTETGANAGTLTQWTTTPGLSQTVTMSTDQTVTFTNTRKTTTVNATKVVIYNGVANPGDDLSLFPVTLTCSNNGSALTGVGLGPSNLAAGASSATATIPTGANCSVSETLSTADQADWTVTTSPAATNITSPTTLTVTNTRKVGKLTILKNIDPPGATLAAGLFTFNIDCTGTTGDATNVVARPGQNYVSGNIPTGVSCTITENPAAGWIVGAPQTITIAEGQPVGNTVTFLNTLKAGVTLKKTVSGLAAGTAWGPFDFTIASTDGGTFSGTTTQSISGSGNVASPGTGAVSWTDLIPGKTYTITETLKDGWTVGLDCGVSDLDPAANVVRFVATAGSSVSCLANNVAAPASLTINKTTVGGNGTFSFTAAAGLDIPGVTTTAGNGTTGAVNVVPGTTLNVAETAPDSSWIAGAVTCAVDPVGSAPLGAYGSPSGIVPGPGDAVVCKVTNTKKGKILVQKTAVGANGDFVFDASWTANPITITTVNGFGEYGSDWLAAGSYTVTERDLGAGWSTSVTCTDGQGNVVNSSSNNTTRTGTAKVDPGETVTCAFTNTKKGTIVIQKVTNPASDAAPFAFTQNIDGSGDITLDTDPNSAGISDTASFINVVNGTYTVTEQPLQGWQLTGLSCVDPTKNSSGSTATGAATIDLAAGETVTCTYTNTKLGGVTVTKTALGPTALVSGNTYRVTYTVDVVNESFLPQTFTLTDAPTFGAGTNITSRSATLENDTVPALGAPTTFSSAPWVLYSGKTIAARDTVTVKVTIEFTVAGSTTNTARDCTLAQGENGTGTLNTATVSYTGGTSSDDACVPIPDPNIGIQKDLAAQGVTRNSDGSYKAVYNVVVTNTGLGTGQYILKSDVLAFGAGITSDAAVVTGPDGSSSVVTLSTGNIGLDSGDSDTYVVTVDNITATGGVTTVDAAKCKSTTSGFGLFNLATITTGGADQSDNACGNLPIADVQIVKDSPTTDSPAAGTSFTYTLKVKNNGPDTADAVVVTDTVPAPLVLTAVDAGSSGLDCSSSNIGQNKVRCTRSSLTVADGEKTITLTVSVPGNTPATKIINVGKVDTTTPETTTTNNTDDDEVNTTVARLTLNKVIDGFGLTLDQVTLRAKIGDTFVIDGSDPNASTSVGIGANVAPGTYTLSELAPAGFTGSVWTCGDVAVTAGQVVVAPGASVICQITNTADPATITFTKTSIGGVGTFTLDVTGGVSPIAIPVTTATSGVAVTSSPTNLVPGTSYAISEAAKAGWVAGDLTCTRKPAGASTATAIGDLSAVVPTAGEAIACSVTNFKLGGITVVKDPVGSVTLVSGNTYAAQFTVKVTNQSFVAQKFSLDEKLSFGSGVTITAATATRTSGADIGEPQAYASVNPWVLYTDKTLPANGSGNNSVTLTLTFTFTIDPSMPSSERDCESEDNPTRATFNTAEVTFGADGTAEDPACLDLPTPSIKITKSTVTNGLVYVPGANGTTGTFTATYEVKVQNDGQGPGQYNLSSDQVSFGEGYSSGSITVAPIGVPTGLRSLDSGAAETYTVTVPGIQVSSTFDRAANVCTSQPETKGKGLFNEASATVPGVISPISDTACYSVSTLTLNKLIQSPNGGELTLEQVTLTASSDGVVYVTGKDSDVALDKGVSGIVLPGSYQLSETNVPGYTGSAWVCNNQAVEPVDGVTTVNVPSGTNVVCTITNTDLPVDIAIDKDDDGATPAPGEVFEYTLTVTNEGLRALDGDEPVYVSDTLPNSDLSWVAEGLDSRCSVDADDSLTVNCELDPADVNDGGVVLTLSVQVALDAEITEWVNQAWVSTEDDSICMPGDTGCTPPPCPVIDEGDDEVRVEAVAIDTNSANNTDCEPTESTPRPTVTVVKTVVGGSNTADFQFDFTLTPDKGSTGGGTQTWDADADEPSVAWTTGLTPEGSYTLSEAAKAGWTQQFLGCSQNEDPIDVTVNTDGSVSFNTPAGANIVCEYTNVQNIKIDVTVECRGNVPWIVYDVTFADDQSVEGFGPIELTAGKLNVPGGVDPDATGLITGIDPSDAPSSAEFLWPGASVDPVTKEAIDWPGWKQLPDGTWVKETDYLTPNLLLGVSIGQPSVGRFAAKTFSAEGTGLEAEVAIDYPPATDACYGPTPTVQVAKTVVGSTTGSFDFVLTAAGNGASVTAGQGTKTYTPGTKPTWGPGVLTPGTYMLTEVNKAGWKQEFKGCTNGAAQLTTRTSTASDGSIVVTFDLPEGGAVTCNFTNTADLVVTANTVCIGNVPYVSYSTTLDGKPYTGTLTLKFVKLTGTDLNGNVIALPPGADTNAGTFLAQPASGQLLWPGAAVDPVTKEAIDWPGWKLVNGEWQRDVDYLTPNLRIDITVTNPPAPVTRGEVTASGDGLQVSATLDYPPATSACYGPTIIEVLPPTTTVPPAQLPRTGGDIGEALQVALIALISGVLVVLLARRRRQPVA
jgi:uncharacterized repeat protein (TIGR01451 family)